MGRSSRTNVSRPGTEVTGNRRTRSAAAAPAVPLARRFALQRLAARQLGLRVPRELATGGAATLPQRVVWLDRWLARELDLAGGKRLPAGNEADPNPPGDDDGCAPTFRSP